MEFCTFNPHQLLPPDRLMHYKYIAICNAQKGDFVTGETICRNAIEYYDTTMNILVLGDLYNNLAIMQMRQLDNKNSINSFQKALEIAKTKNDEKLILKIQFNLSTLYTKIRNYDLSIKTNNDLLNIVTSKEKIDSVFVGNIYRNLGTAYFKKGNLEKCKNYFDLAYKIHKQKNDIDGLTEETGAFGEYYRIKKDYPNSIKWYQTNLEICRQSNNNFGIEKTHISLGKIYIELKDYEKATLYIDSAIFISKKYKNNEDLVHANSLKAKILLEQDSIKQASLVILQNDSIKADNAKKADIQNVQELATKYNVQEKEYKIKENEKVITTTKTKSKTYLLLGILASLSTLVLSFLFYKIHKQNKLIQIQKQEILHNNSNSLRNLKNILINQTSTSSNSLENQQRIEAIDILNRMLYENGGQTTANINDYLPALCNVKKITTDNKVDIQVTSTNITLGFNQLKDIGQIVNELTMNAIKYAFKDIEKPIIKINVFEKNNSIVLNIYDNGKGFNKAILENGNNTGFGLKYVNILVKQNNGTIDINTESGTQIAIKIKKIAV
jgi:two-component sensor histidine kinase